MAAEKKFRSMLHKYITKELYIELRKLTLMHSVNNNAKGFALKELLKKYNIPYTSLGSGTNRFGILIDGYAFKFALDPDGMVDNRREMLYSKRLYPYVVKCYESFKNGLVAVTEYVEIFNLDAFYKYKNQMKEILSEISKVFLVGDVGVTTKNYINWGIRHVGGRDEICIMDYAYIYDVKYGIFKCSCGTDALLKYDTDYVNFICPHCGKKYTFSELRRKVTRKSQEEEIGNILRLGYVLHSEEEVQPINSEFTKINSGKKKKELTGTDLLIKRYHDEQRKQQEMIDYIDYGISSKDLVEIPED